MRAWATFWIACALFGCAENKWGSRCFSDGDCGDGLVCIQTGTEEEPNVSGLCKYPEGELRCAPGTVIEGAECVPDPNWPPPPTCGEGTHEEELECVLDEVPTPDAGGDTDAGSDAGSDPDAGVDAGPDAGPDAG